MFEIMDYLPFPVFAADPQRKILYMNRAACDTYGYSMEECAGKDAGILAEKECGDCVACMDRLSGTGGRLQILSPSGRGGYAGAALLQDVPGYGDIYLAWHGDSAAGEMDQTMVSCLMRHLPCGIIECRNVPPFEIQYANEAFYAIYGYTRERAREENKRSWLDFIDPDDRQILVPVLRDHHARNKMLLDFEIRGLDSDQKTVWNNVSAYMTEGPEGPVVGALITDIGETRMRLKYMECRNDNFKLALAQSSDIMWEYNPRTNIVSRMDDSKDDPYGIIGAADKMPEEIVQQGYIHPDSVDEYLDMYSKLRRGEKNGGCTVRVKDKEQAYRWFRILFQLVPGKDGRPERAIGITQEVTTEKNAQLRYLHEKQYRTSMTYNAIFAYEINLTKNKLVSGNVEWLDDLNLTRDTSYAKLVEKVRERVTVPQQLVDFNRSLSREALLRAYEEGRREVQCEYNRFNLQNRAIWVRTVVNMIKDPASGDIFGYIYIKDIDEEKRTELELKQKAERDPLTGLYNRATARYKIDELLKEYRHSLCAFLMIDIDNFKTVNDTFGHTYGDAVLSELAHKLKCIVRSNDIAVRVGGDEMAVFFCNINRKQDVYDRAEEICRALQMSYSSGKNKLDISGSIGLTFAPRHGTTFDTLYKKADIALYHAKNRGKNRYEVFDETLSMDMNRETKIDRSFNKNFSENISEYIFKILYHSSNLDFSIQSVLELLAKHYDAQYCYLILYHEKEHSFAVEYEWFENGTESQKEIIQQFPFELMEQYWNRFNEDGIFYAEDVASTAYSDSRFEQLSKRLKTKSLLQCSMNVDGQLKGFIGVDNSRKPRSYTEEQQNTLKFSAEIIGTFLNSKQIERDRERHLEAINTVLDNLGTYLYVVEPETMKIVYINQQLNGKHPEAECGMKCHKLFCGGDVPCEECPIKELIKSGERRHVMELYNCRAHIWVEASAKWIKWIDGKEYCLVSCFDITKYKM